MAWDHYESTQDELLQLPKQTAYSWEMGSAYFEMLLLIANFCNSKILMSFSNFALNIFLSRNLAWKFNTIFSWKFNYSYWTTEGYMGLNLFIFSL